MSERASEADERPLTTKTWVYRTIMFFVHIAYTIVFPTRVRGREHVPAEGAFLIAANHESFLDIPLVAKALAPRHASFVARDTLADASWLGFVMRQCGAVLIDRNKGDRAALRSAASHLEHGDLVVMFPEGTRSLDGQVGAFKKGALLAARMAGAPIVPCGIRGSFEAWPRNRKLPRPGRVEVTFGPPVDADRSDAADVVRDAVLALAGDSAAPANPEHPTAPGGVDTPHPPSSVNP